MPSVGDKIQAAYGGRRPAIAYGTVSITPSAANTATSASVVFPFTFASIPVVQVTSLGAGAGTQVTGVSASNRTTTGCDIYVSRTNTTATTLMWTAVGDDGL